MNSERIKELHEQTGYPQSISVYKALLQVWNECTQSQQGEMVRVDENGDRVKEPTYDMIRERYHTSVPWDLMMHNLKQEYQNARQIPLAQYELEQKLREVKDEIERLRDNDAMTLEMLQWMDECTFNNPTSEEVCQVMTMHTILKERLSPPSNEQMKGSDEVCDYCKGMGRKYAGVPLGNICCPKCKK